MIDDAEKRSCRARGAVSRRFGVSFSGESFRIRDLLISIDFGFSGELSMLGVGMSLFNMKPGPVYGPIEEGYTELALTNFILGKPPVGKPLSLSMVV